MTGQDRLSIFELIRKRESEDLEFKESLGELREIIETVVAFANRSGGKILIGVKDNGEIIGVDIGKGTLENLINNIINSTEPPIYPSVSVENLRGKDVIVIDVPSGANKPYFYRGRAYIRVGRANRVLPPEELREILLKTVERAPWDEKTMVDFEELEIDQEAIRLFVEEVKKSRRAPIEEPVDPKNLFLKLNLLKEGKVKAAGVLLFDVNPQRYFPWAVIKAGRFKDSLTVIDETQIGGNLFRQVEEALKFIMRNIRKTFRIDPHTGRRIDMWEYPLEALREAIINAIIHRDYSVYSSVYIKIYDDKLTIINPGGLLEPLTIDDLRREHPSILRNPNIANIFYLAGYIEKWGIGTLRMIRECEERGMPPPDFSVEKEFFRVEFRRKYELSEKEQKALNYIRRVGRVRRKDIQKYLGVSERTARRILSKLEEYGLIKRHGRGNNIYYTSA